MVLRLSEKNSKGFLEFGITLAVDLVTIKNLPKTIVFSRQLSIYCTRKEMQGSSHQLKQPFKLISLQLTGSCGTDSFLFRLHLTANSRCCNSTSYASGLLNLSPYSSSLFSLLGCLCVYYMLIVVFFNTVKH